MKRPLSLCSPFPSCVYYHIDQSGLLGGVDMLSWARVNTETNLLLKECKLELTFANNCIPISTKTKCRIRQLHLWDMRNFDVEACPNLITLDIFAGHYDINEDMERSLTRCLKLQNVKIRYGTLRNMNSFAVCRNLRMLDICVGQTADLTALQHCLDLEELILSIPSPQESVDISTLAKCTKLRSVRLNFMVSDISPLGNCPELEIVVIHGEVKRVFGKCPKLSVLMINHLLITTR